MMLASIWFFLLCILWALWIATDGFDLGTGILYPFTGKTPGEKSKLIAAIAPLWDGNEVWLITAAGATFAAYPAVYAGLFSFMYIPFTLLLFSLILRGVALEFIYKGQGTAWLKTWGIVFFSGSIMAPFVFGIIFGNVFQGMAFDSADYRGGILDLVNPFSVLTGTLMTILCIMHGAIWIIMNTADPLKTRAQSTSHFVWSVAFVVLLIFLAEAPAFSELHRNYLNYPVLFILPVIMIACFICIRIFLAKAKPLISFGFSMAFIVMFFLCAFTGLYPEFLPSSIDKAASLTVANSSSGSYTLGIMTAVAFILVPVIIASQVFVYRVFRFKNKPV